MMSMNSEVEKMQHGKSPVPCASGIFDCCLLPLDGRSQVSVHCFTSTESIPKTCKSYNLRPN